MCRLIIRCPCKPRKQESATLWPIGTIAAKGALLRREHCCRGSIAAHTASCCRPHSCPEALPALATIGCPAPCGWLWPHAAALQVTDVARAQVLDFLLGKWDAACRRLDGAEAEYIASGFTRRPQHRPGRWCCCKGAPAPASAAPCKAQNTCPQPSATVILIAKAWKASGLLRGYGEKPQVLLLGEWCCDGVVGCCDLSGINVVRPRCRRACGLDKHVRVGGVRAGGESAGRAAGCAAGVTPMYSALHVHRNV